MSALYVELRSRIPVIAAKTPIGRARLQDAQDQVGLSNENLARLIPVSEKTWRRWKEAGEVPTYALPQLAKVLHLELIEEGSGQPMDSAARRLLEEAAGGVVQTLDAQAEIGARLEAIERKLDELLESRATRRATSSRGQRS